VPRKHPLSFSCKSCGKVVDLVPGGDDRRRMYCSPACKLWAFNHKDGVTRIPFIDRPKRAHKPKPSCLECGSLCSRYGQKFCSDLCRTSEQRRKAKQRRKALFPVRSRELQCQNATCGRTFVHQFKKGDGEKKYCSPRCMKRESRRGQSQPESRARHAGRVVAYGIKPLLVFERDGWRCQLCGVRTPKRLRGTQDAAAPEIDHIIPLSKGGGHTWDNVQCACKRCNNTKSDTILGQLRLAV
jgi:5-methylcytosine-specific restriction endonuclease McrA